MGNSEIFVGLDIGTSAIKVIVAESASGNVNVIGVGSERSEGVSRGVIVDIDKAADSIKRAVKKAETQANLKINDVVISIPANMLEIVPCQGMIGIGAESREITESDVRQVMAAAMVQNLQGEREVVSLRPAKFTVDGFTNIRDPRGMIGIRLEMNGVIYTAPKTIVHNAQTAVRKAGLNISHEVVTPLALGNVTLTDGEKNFGAIIIDMGAGQTSVSVMHDNNLKLNEIDYEGGNHITHDISVVLNTTIENASHYKIYYGNTDSSSVNQNDVFMAEVVGKTEPENIPLSYLSEIIEARVEQIFERLKKKLKLTNALDLPGGIIITGGVAATPGIQEVAERIFNTQVRIFTPEQMGMRYPSFSVGLGLVKYAAMLSDTERIADKVVNGVALTDEQSVNSLNDSDRSEKSEGFMKRFTQQKSKKDDEIDEFDDDDDDVEELDESKTSKTSKKNAGGTVRDIWNKFFD